MAFGDIPGLEDKNDYDLKRKKRGKGSYKSGPYADLKLPPPNKPSKGFGFALPDGKKDEPPELFPKQTTFWALKRQKWLCEGCGVLLRYSDMSKWEGPIAEFKRNDNNEIKGYCPECFELE